MSRTSATDHAGGAAAAAPTLAGLSRATGGLAMVAMDQRESLRTMIDDAGLGRPQDAEITAFKLTVARALGPLASGFLIDREPAFDQVRGEGILPSSCGLILAVDALQQDLGGPVQDTAIDEYVVNDDTAFAGVAAVKLLVIWRRDEQRDRRVELAQRFVDLARARGVLSVLEPVARPTAADVSEGWSLDVAIREAARELSPLGPDLYKAQVPQAGIGEPDELERACVGLDREISGPWVVLSQGVDAHRFPAAVQAACRGGASGFLAGRALWQDAVGRPLTDVEPLARPRLEKLIEIVDKHARPWWEAS